MSTPLKSSVEKSSNKLKDFADNELRAGGRSIAGLASVKMVLSILSRWLATSERAPRVLRVRIRLLYGFASAEKLMVDSCSRACSWTTMLLVSLQLETITMGIHPLPHTLTPRVLWSCLLRVVIRRLIDLVIYKDKMALSYLPLKAFVSMVCIITAISEMPPPPSTTSPACELAVGFYLGTTACERARGAQDHSEEPVPCHSPLTARVVVFGLLIGFFAKNDQVN